MHLVLLVIIALLILVIIYQQGSVNKPASNKQMGTEQPNSLPSKPLNHKAKIAYLGSGKLYLIDEHGKTEEIHSPFIQTALEKRARAEELHGWKKGTSFSSAYSSGGTREFGMEGGIDLQITSAEFIDNKTIAYFIGGRNIGGLFELDLEEEKERRILHQTGLNIKDLQYDAENNRFLCSALNSDGLGNIASICRESGNMEIYTSGDTIDSCPNSVDGEKNKIVFQTQGIGRNAEGYSVGLGSAQIQLLDSESQSIESILENTRLDFLQPTVHPDGSLLFIQRPYEIHSYSTTNLLIDILAFPYRLGKAIFHYLNFFSQIYANDTLTSADGPRVKASRKNIELHGKRIDADKELRTSSGKSSPVESLVPNTWQLIARSEKGEDRNLATNVVCFDISSDGDIFYSNGTGIFVVTNGEVRLLSRDLFVERLITN